MFNDTKPRLTSEQIAEKLRLFNETYDWSVFDDVPESQHVDVMYPHRIDMLKMLTKLDLNAVYRPAASKDFTLHDPQKCIEITEDARKILNELYGKL